MLLNRPPAPVETYNDLDSELVNFFRVLRNEKEGLIEAIGLTPFSREELRIATEDQEAHLSDLERARRFFVRARQVRTGLAQTASEGRWAHCLLTSRAGMGGAVSRWLGSVEGLSEIVQRLLRVQIENAPALQVIARYDSPQTMFYCDPPYVHGTRGDSRAYGFEMTDAEHEELATTLRRLQGKVAISGYASELYEDLYAGWTRLEAPTRMVHSSKGERTEILWVNYELPILPGAEEQKQWNQPISLFSQ